MLDEYLLASVCHSFDVVGTSVLTYATWQSLDVSVDVTVEGTKVSDEQLSTTLVTIQSMPNHVAGGLAVTLRYPQVDVTAYSSRSVPTGRRVVSE